MVKNKNLLCPCKTLLQTRVSYTVSVARQSYQRGIFAMLLKKSLDHITIRWAWGSEGGSRGFFEILHFPIQFLAKKGCFLHSRGENEISRLLGHLKKFFGCPWKNPLLPPPLEKSFQRPCRFRWLQKVGAPETPAKALLLVLLSVSDYKCV